MLFTLSSLEVFPMRNAPLPLLFALTPFNFLTALKFSLYHWFEQFNCFITWCSFLHASDEQWPSCLLGLYFKLIWKNVIFRFFFHLRYFSYINIWTFEIISLIIDTHNVFLTFFCLSLSGWRWLLLTKIKDVSFKILKTT